MSPLFPLQVLRIGFRLFRLDDEYYYLLSHWADFDSQFKNNYHLRISCMILQSHPRYSNSFVSSWFPFHSSQLHILYFFTLLCFRTRGVQLVLCMHMSVGHLLEHHQPARDDTSKECVSLPSSLPPQIVPLLEGLMHLCPCLLENWLDWTCAGSHSNVSHEDNSPYLSRKHCFFSVPLVCHISWDLGYLISMYGWVFHRHKFSALWLAVSLYVNQLLFFFANGEMH